MPFVSERSPPQKVIHQPSVLEEEEAYIEYPSARLGAITRKRNQINELLLDRSENAKVLVQKLFSDYLQKVEAFVEACEQQKKKPGVASDEIASLVDWREQNLEIEKKFQKKLRLWLNATGDEEELPQPLQRCEDDRSDTRSGVSRRTSGTHRSSTSSVLARLLEKRAKIAASERVYGEKEEIRRAEFELEERKRKLTLFEEKAEADNLEKELFIFEGTLHDQEVQSLFVEDCIANPVVSGANNPPTSRPDVSQEIASCQKPESKLHEENTSHNYSELTQVLSKQNEITVMLAQSQSKGILPMKDLDPFDGTDPTQYRFFILSFEVTIENRCPDDTDRYYLLLKYTKGEAHELIKSCCGPDICRSYRMARNLLESNYGNEYKIANLYLEKLEKWPEIKSEDVRALNELSTFLTSCANMMKNMNGFNQLNSLKEVRDIVKKLPFDMRKRFRSQAATLIDNGGEVQFQTLVNFVDREVKALKLPMLGDISDKSKKPGSRSSKEEKKRSFVTLSSVNGSKKCPCCTKTNHELDRCIFFNKKLMKEREDFIRKKGLCFGCLNPDHTSKACKNRLECKKCRKSHPTCLHRDGNVQSKVTAVTVTEVPIESSDSQLSIMPVEEVQSYAAEVISVSSSRWRRIVCAAVLVDVRIKGMTEKIRTYMGMDQWATDGFIDEDLLKELNVQGKETTLCLTTMGNRRSKMATKIIENVEILSIDGQEMSLIPKLYSKKDWPFELEDSPRKSDVVGYPELQKLPFQFADKKIGLLVGVNTTEIVKPLRVVNTTRRGPYATLHKFGWALNGPVKMISSPQREFCHRTRVQEDTELSTEKKLEELYSREFVDNFEEGVAPSFDDLKWVQKVENSLRIRDDGHFEISLPFNDEHVSMPNNYGQARHRLAALTTRFLKDTEYLNEYATFMKTMREHKYIEEVPLNELHPKPGKVWYLTHFGVRHKRKGKLRIVFDCSQKFEAVSLNDRLLQGPDLTNSLVGVLLRFRQEKIAVTGDIESMFYQVKVPKESSDFMRFLWFPEDDINKEPIQYRLKVHVFGAKSSPSIANFALRKSALIADGNISKLVTETILNSFYVDDLMKSLDDEKSATRMLKDVESVLRKSGFNLTSFISNSREVLQSLPSEKLSKELKNIELSKEALPYERALGVVWNVANDSLGYHITVKEQPCTKRGVLSTIFSIYDPTFIVSPAIIPAKKIYQEISISKLGWDDPLPNPIRQRWNNWKRQIVSLNEYEVPRCFKLSQHAIENTQLHVFVDGSETAYGAVAYLRFVDAQNFVSCSIAMAKVRLTPLNRTSLKTIPRIELNAAKVGIELQQKLKKELELKIDGEYFWSDSVTVLNYIKSSSGRFQRFVANRVAFIRSHSDINQWRFVPTSLNIADMLSRGAKSTRDFMACKEWKEGPEFLSKDVEEWPELPELPSISEDEAELIRNCNVAATRIEETPIQKLLYSTSNWFKLRYRVAAFLRLREKLLHKECRTGKFDVSELQRSEIAIWRAVQRAEFNDEYELLRSNKALKKNHPFTKLTPFVDGNELIRVGGRLANAPIHADAKHPILLPRGSQVVRIFVEDAHRSCGHLGREYVLSLLRQSVYIVGATTVVKEVIRKCIACKKIQGRPSEQIMADLPSDRISGDRPAFDSTGIDYFGPFLVSRGRSRAQEKRFGVIFSCMASRAIHIEVAHSLDTSSFINALRRFIARRGQVKHIRSDNGTNLVSGNKELKEALKEWNEAQIDEFCKMKGIQWTFQPPYASHHGGAWEREIRTIRKVLAGLMTELPTRTSVNDETLSTLICEVESILNNRPLTALSSDPNDLEPLTPNHILLFDNGTNFPIGLFSKDDLYCKRRWRQVQHLADIFWHRWRREYLPILIERQKWTMQRRPHKIGDLVLVVNELLPRNLWCTGRIIEIKPDSKGNVRVARVKVSRHKSGSNLRNDIAYLDRSINKLILLRTVDEL